MMYFKLDSGSSSFFFSFFFEILSYILYLWYVEFCNLVINYGAGLVFIFLEIELVLCGFSLKFSTSPYLRMEQFSLENIK
jgi:hypothetical protein